MRQPSVPPRTPRSWYHNERRPIGGRKKRQGGLVWPGGQACRLHPLPGGINFGRPCPCARAALQKKPLRPSDPRDIMSTTTRPGAATASQDDVNLLIHANHWNPFGI